MSAALKRATPHVQVQLEDFDPQKLAASLSHERRDVGAVVTFTGYCRDENGRLTALELEHYPGMAEAELRRIADEACNHWPLTGLVLVHRSGKILPGEQIVFVAAASSHRRAAFEASDFVMDFLKTRAPFWKKEHLLGEESASWVAEKEADLIDMKRWRR